MKKSVKIALTAGGILTLGILVWRRWKKAEKKIISDEAKRREEIEELGLDPDYVQEEIVPVDDDGNFIKPLFMAVYGNSEFRAESLVDAIYQDEPVVFVQQNTFRKKNEDIINFDIHFEIPEERLGEFKMRDFVLAGRELAQSFWSEIRYVEEPRQGLEGHMILELKEKGCSPIQRDFRIPEVMYSHKKFLEGSKSNGLEEFIDAFNGGDEEAKEIILKELEVWAVANMPDMDFEETKLLRVFMTYKVSFNVVNPSDDPGLYRCGVDLKMATDMLKKIVDNFSVKAKDFNYKKNKGKAPEIKYDKLVFCAPNEEGNWSFLKYYDKDDENHVFVDTCIWDS